MTARGRVIPVQEQNGSDFEDTNHTNSMKLQPEIPWWSLRRCARLIPRGAGSWPWCFAQDAIRA